MADVRNKFLPGSYRSSYEYLAGVPQISDERWKCFQKDKAPPDDLAAQGEAEIRAACEVLRQRRVSELVETAEILEGEDDE